MPNRLAKEKSPYLLQHAQNPVNWYPWSDEAFARAAEEDKPIFLSIGYSTCHWCHVMERESFEDEDVAALLNDAFICIKVDREERPDIDNIYMTVCTMMTGSGGWPLTIIMTPAKKPFFAGTYFAKHSGSGRMGLMDMIPRLKDIWHNRREEIIQSTENIMAALLQQNRTDPGDKLDQQVFQFAFNELKNRYDSVNGGFSKAPKFPTPHIINFLLRHWKMTGDVQALDQVEHTLINMRLGGIFDHIGFGFHRYSTDEKWLLPHFEKMLYDQALLAVAYLEGFQATGNPLFKQTADEIFTYVLRDMISPEGGFYSAEDADSEGVEGKFYTWSHKELEEVLSPEELEFVHQTYNIYPEGNFHDETTGKQTGANIFHLTEALTAENTSSRQGSEDFIPFHENIRKKLFDKRETRIHPHKDDKILTDWNGLMIGALAFGSRILANEKYLEAAQKSARFILLALQDNQKLRHRYREGEAAVDGMLNDYAYIVWGLLELYAADFNTEILEAAIQINDRMLETFWDDENAGFFLTPGDGETLLIRPKEVYDGALPSGNSIALHNLLRLESLTANPELGAKARLLVKAFSEKVQEVPSGYTQFLAGAYFMFSDTIELVIVGDLKAQDTLEMISFIQDNFSPQIVTLVKHPPDAEKLAVLAPFTADYTAINNRATAYVCHGKTCESPITDARQLVLFLNNLDQTQKG